MSKLTDDKHEAAEAVLPGLTPPIVQPDRRMRRVPGMVDDHARAIIVRAITLRLAMVGEMSDDDTELYGLALAGVCGEWLKMRSSELREK